MFKLHGSINQKKRTKTWKDFATCKAGILFCTDVAARGLDLPAVDWIVQYDPPEEVDDYVHRSGRTARMGRNGSAVMFLCQSEVEYIDVLNNVQIELKQLDVEDVLAGLQDADTPYQASMHPTTGRMMTAGQQLKGQLLRVVSTNPHLTNLGTHAFRSYLRAYAAYPRALKHIFHPKRLNLGHIADSFALSSLPKVLGAGAKADKTERKSSNKLDKRVTNMNQTLRATYVSDFKQPAAQKNKFQATSSFNEFAA
jgi:ATP-dependent RNA helicase DDX31/DBP7